MKRTWLTYVAITASLIAGFLCSTAFADNKGMKFSGGSTRSFNSGATQQRTMQFQQSNNTLRNLGNIQGVQTQIHGGSFNGGQLGQILGNGNGGGKPQIKINPGTQIFNGQGNSQGNANGIKIGGTGIKIGGTNNNGLGITLGNSNVRNAIGQFQGGGNSSKKCYIAPKCIDPCFSKGCSPCGNSCSPCLKNWNVHCTPWWWTCHTHYCNQPIYYVCSQPIVITVPVVVGVPVVQEQLVQVPVGSTITMQALGLGDVAGRLILVMDKVSLEGQINDWKLDAVTATLPMFSLAAPTLAELVIVKADGQPATSMKIQLIPAQPAAVGAVQQAQAIDPAGELSAAAALAR